MPHPILVTGAAGGAQGSTGRVITTLLREQGLPVRAFVHRHDHRSEELRALGAEVFAGDLLDPASVQKAMEGVKRAYFTYPVKDGLLEAATIFAAMARDAGLEFVVNNSQLQRLPGEPGFRDLCQVPSFRNLQHRLADRIFDWAEVSAVHLQTPPYYENVRVLVSATLAEKDAVFLPWGAGDAVLPLTGAEDVARVAATLLSSPGLPSTNVLPLVSEAPTVKQIFAALEKAIGRPVRYVPITDEQWADAVKSRLNPHALDHLSHLWRYFRESGAEFKTTDTVRKVTGRKPQSLEEFFRLNATRMAGAAQ